MRGQQHSQPTPTLLDQRCNVPSALLAEWPGSSMCHCGNTGVKRTLNKRQHTKLTLEKKTLPPLLLGFELATFQSQVRHSIPAYSFNRPWKDSNTQAKQRMGTQADRQTGWQMITDRQKSILLASPWAASWAWTRHESERPDSHDSPLWCSKPAESADLLGWTTSSQIILTLLHLQWHH